MIRVPTRARASADFDRVSTALLDRQESSRACTRVDAAHPSHRGRNRAALPPGPDEDADPPRDRPGSDLGRLLRGACATTDLLYTSHRTHGNYLAKGGDLKAMLCEMHCRVNGCVGSRGGSMHLIDKRVGMAGTSAIVGGAVPIAIGAALAAQMKQRRPRRASCSSAMRRPRKA